MKTLAKHGHSSPPGATSSRNLSVPSSRPRSTEAEAAAVLARAVELGLPFDLMDVVYRAARAMHKLSQECGSTLSVPERRRLFSAMNHLLAALSKRKQEFTRICDRDVSTSLAAQAFAQLLKARERISSSALPTDPEPAGTYRYLKGPACYERAPNQRVALAFAALEHAIRRELSSENVATGQMKECLPSFLQDLPPTFQHGMHSLMIGLLRQFRARTLHGSAQLTPEVAEVLVDLVNRLHLFVKHPNERNHDEGAPMPTEPAYWRLRSGAPLPPCEGGSRRTGRETGIRMIHRGEELLRRSLIDDPEHIAPRVRRETGDILVSLRGLFAALDRAADAPSGAAEPQRAITPEGRRLQAYQELESTVDAALAMLPGRPRKSSRVARERLARLFEQEEFRGDAGLTAQQAQDVSALLQSLYMLHRNLPVHEERFQRRSVGQIVETLCRQVADRSIGRFMRTRGWETPLPLPFTGKDLMEVHPLLLQACWGALRAGDYEEVFRSTWRTLGEARRSWTFTPDASYCGQRGAAQAIDSLYECLPRLFSQGVLHGPDKPVERAFEALAIGSALLGYLCPDAPAPRLRPGESLADMLTQGGRKAP